MYMTKSKINNADLYDGNNQIKVIWEDTLDNHSTHKEKQMTDTPTTEEIAQHYTAMGHSVDLLNAGQPEDMEDADWADTVSRNVEHLELMVAKDFWTTEDMTAANGYNGGNISVIKDLAPVINYNINASGLAYRNSNTNYFAEHLIDPTSINITDIVGSMDNFINDGDIAHCFVFTFFSTALAIGGSDTLALLRLWGKVLD